MGFLCVLCVYTKERKQKDNTPIKLFILDTDVLGETPFFIGILEFTLVNTYHFISQIPSCNLPCHNCIHCYSMIKGTNSNHPRSGVDSQVKWRITCKTICVLPKNVFCQFIHDKRDSAPRTELTILKLSALFLIYMFALKTSACCN